MANKPLRLKFLSRYPGTEILPEYAGTPCCSSKSAFCLIRRCCCTALDLSGEPRNHTYRGSRVFLSKVRYPAKFCDVRLVRERQRVALHGIFSVNVRRKPQICRELEIQTLVPWRKRQPHLSLCCLGHASRTSWSTLPVLRCIHISIY